MLIFVFAAGDEKVELDSSDESDDEYVGFDFLAFLFFCLLIKVCSLWTADPEEERRFYRAYNHFCRQKGTVLKRTPMLGFRDLDLFRLHSLVQREGGFEQVCLLCLCNFLFAVVTQRLCGWLCR